MLVTAGIEELVPDSDIVYDSMIRDWNELGIYDPENDLDGEAERIARGYMRLALETKLYRPKCHNNQNAIDTYANLYSKSQIDAIKPILTKQSTAGKVEELADDDISSFEFAGALALPAPSNDSE